MYEVESCIHGFHVYCTVRTPYIEEQLDYGLDSGNNEDPFTVAVHSCAMDDLLCLRALPAKARSDNLHSYRKSKK